MKIADNFLFTGTKLRPRGGKKYKLPSVFFYIFTSNAAISWWKSYLSVRALSLLPHTDRLGCGCAGSHISACANDGASVHRVRKEKKKKKKRIRFAASVRIRAKWILDLLHCSPGGLFFFYPRYYIINGVTRSTVREAQRRAGQSFDFPLIDPIPPPSLFAIVAVSVQAGFPIL